MNETTSSLFNQWINEWVNERKNQWMIQGKKERMNERMIDFFLELPIPQAKSSLSSLGYFFTELLLISGTFSFPRSCSELSPSAIFSQSYFLAFVPQFFSSRGHYKAFCTLQLQSCIAQQWRHVQKLPFSQLLQGVLHSPAAILHSTTMTPCSKTTFLAAVTRRFALSSCNPA